jgi:type IV fimbrial biogenesis protein FimT
MVSRQPPGTALAPRPAAHGFTLPELLAGVAILAVLSSIAAPSFTSLIATSRARSTSSDLYASLVRARSEAIKRNAEVSLVQAISGQWQGGWRMPDPANANAYIETHGAVPGATVTGPASVVFLPNGRVKGGTQPSFDIAVSGQSQHRCIRVDLGGHPNQSSSAC